MLASIGESSSNLRVEVRLDGFDQFDALLQDAAQQAEEEVAVGLVEAGDLMHGASIAASSAPPMRHW